jgi:DNA-directed RNA polymerase subunit RPC12/RpoP
MISIALGFEKPNKRLKSMFFLLDFWKTGMKDCFVDVDISKEEFDQRFSVMAGRPSIKIDINKTKVLIQRGLYIANAVGTPIPWDYQRWRYMLGDMSTVPNPAGSSYKCARCGSELPDPIVDLMKQHAQSDDVHFYMVCGKCAGEFED